MEKQQELLSTKVFKYLDNLRESGVTNMLGVTEFITDTFNISKDTAKELLIEWMQTFNQRHPNT